MKIIRVWAIRRSGHHAVINWIKGCLEQENSVGLVNALFMPFHKKTFDGYQEIIKNKPDYLIYNIEDESFNKMRDGRDTRLVDKLNEYNLPKKVDHEIYVMRDPFNCFASRLVASKVRPTVTKKLGAVSERVINLYLEYFAKFQEKESTNEVFIDFNRWFSNRGYRVKLSKRFNVPFTDEGLGVVSTWGGGSSFDHYKYRKGGQGMKMDVLNRWKKLKGNKKYMSIFSINPKFIQGALKVYPKETHEFFKIKRKER
jgi:hypothetical protein